MSNKGYLIIGGDERIFYLAKKMQNNDINIYTKSVVGYKDSENEIVSRALKEGASVILPIPFTSDGINIFSINPNCMLSIKDIIKKLSEKNVVYGGCFNDKIKNMCQMKGIKLVDYFCDDTFEMKNSIATAEGSIAEAIVRSKTNIHGSRCLVLGYGKCAKAISGKLKGMDGKVTVCARRNEQRTQAEIAGVDVIGFNELESRIEAFDFIFNTVPSIVLTDNILKNVNQDVVIIDIASKPGGTDFKACELYGINASLCLGLPGKYSPKTSADIIYEAIV